MASAVTAAFTACVDKSLANYKGIECIMPRVEYARTMYGRDSKLRAMPVHRAAELWNLAIVTPTMNSTTLNELMIKFISDAMRIQLQRELPQYATLCATTTTRIGPRALLQFFCTNRVIPTWAVFARNIGFRLLSLCAEAKFNSTNEDEDKAPPAPARPAPAHSAPTRVTIIFIIIISPCYQFRKQETKHKKAWMVLR